MLAARTRGGPRVIPLTPDEMRRVSDLLLLMTAFCAFLGIGDALLRRHPEWTERMVRRVFGR